MMHCEVTDGFRRLRFQQSRKCIATVFAHPGGQLRADERCAGREQIGEFNQFITDGTSRSFPGPANDERDAVPARCRPALFYETFYNLGAGARSSRCLDSPSRR